MRRLEEFSLKWRIGITSYSDIDSNLYTRLWWADCWYKYELIKAFGEMGNIVTEEDPDIVVHLFGTPTKLPRNTYKIIWIHSHPDRVNPHLLEQYDKIFCRSSSFIRKINQMGFEAELMIGATAKKPVQRDKKYDIIFVGNARPELPYGRKIVRDLGELAYNFKFKVWGKDWESILPKGYYHGQYFDDQRLNEVYASSLIALNDHHEDMRREGFISSKIFDILASGGFCVSDKNPGVEEIFGDTVPQYESPEHLKELVDFYVGNPDERLRLMERGRKIALSYTWKRVAEQFLGAMENLGLRKTDM